MKNKILKELKDLDLAVNVKIEEEMGSIIKLGEEKAQYYLTVESDNNQEYNMTRDILFEHFNRGDGQYWISETDIKKYDFVLEY